MAENCAFDLLEDRCAWSSMSAKRSPGPGISCQEDRRLAEGLAISLTKGIQTRASEVFSAGTLLQRPVALLNRPGRQQ